LTKNEKDELFENSIQTYVQYPEELKQKGKKVVCRLSLMLGGVIRVSL
jgi:hypothetical protein